MRKKTQRSFQTRVGVIDENRKSNMIARLESKISWIIEELRQLQQEKDEESMIRLSNLTQERDRLMQKLEELKRTKTVGSDMKLSNKKEAVNIGDSVLLTNNGKNLEVVLVGDYEADSTKSEISTLSPLGSSLLNRSVGDAFSVPTPGGSLDYQVLAIK